MPETHALIIEDNPTNIEVLTELLSVLGATFTTIQDPTHLERCLLGLPTVDIVFVDLEMPKRNGYEVLKILRTYPIEAPIVAYTVHTSEINTAKESGFDSFLGKPLRGDRFPHQLSKILSGEPVWEAG
jgi:two-component system, cell cycle response regulator DivK